MTKTILFVTIVTLTLPLCHGEAFERIISKDGANNLYFDDEIFNPQTIKLFHDSGRVENGFKEGRWIEYSLDSTYIAYDKEQSMASIEESHLPSTLRPVLQKEVGIYNQGLKDSLWTSYASISTKPPFFWIKSFETYYQAGEKHGQEITYCLNDTISLKSYVKGQEIGMGKEYSQDYPHILQKRYEAINGEYWIKEKYRPTGELRIKCRDTIRDGIDLQYCEEYYQSGALEMKGCYRNGEEEYGIWTIYYENGTLEAVVNNRNGNYKKFHPNGQLWTERTYKGDTVWDVISNHDSKGKSRDAGTLKNGKGTLKLYKEDGSLRKTLEYSEGQKIVH